MFFSGTESELDQLNEIMQDLMRVALNCMLCVSCSWEIALTIVEQISSGEKKHRSKLYFRDRGDPYNMI
jgi:hypothetical protein